MKYLKSIVVVFVAFVLILPLNVLADKFVIKDANLSVEFDSSKWYVFTLDNIYDNDELSKLGLTSTDLENFFKTNNAFLYANCYDNESNSVLGMYAVRVQIDDIDNLSDYTDSELKDFVQELSSSLNATKSDIVTLDDNLFTYFEFVDVNGSFLIEYYTIVDGYGISFVTEKIFNASEQASTIEITEQEKESIREIISTISFDSKSNNGLINVVIKVLIGAAIGASIAGVIVLIFNLIKKNSKKEKKNDDNKFVKDFDEKDFRNNYITKNLYSENDDKTTSKNKKKSSNDVFDDSSLPKGKFFGGLDDDKTSNDNNQNDNNTNGGGMFF